MNTTPDVTIIVPTYQEAETLPHLVEAVAIVRATVGARYELLVMDDDSPDGTADVGRDLGQKHDWLRIHVRHANRGLAPAVLEGIGMARGDIIVVMDADLSHPPRRIPDLVAALTEGVDMAIGSRYVAGGSTDGSWGVLRKWNSLAATWMARPLSDAKDPMSGFLAFRRERLVGTPTLNPIGYKIGLEILVKASCEKVVEIPIRFADRMHGQSKLSTAEQFRYLRHVGRLYAFKMSHGSSGLAALFIMLGTLIRLVAAATIGLGIDESYQVACARQFHWSFFDHPPVSFWMVTAAVEITGSASALVVRLPFILFFVLTSLLMYGLTSRLFGRRAAAWATGLLNVSPLYAIAAGSWVIPDGPMIAGVLASGLCLTRVLGLGRPVNRGGEWRCWCLAGVWLGTAMLSKYLALLFVLGVLLYLVSTKHRRWFTRPHPYAGALLADVLVTPVLAWNAGHDWASFVFQGSRAQPVGGLQFEQVAVMLGGQALYLLPWIWWPLLVEGAKAVRGGRRSGGPWFCACLGLLPVVLMTVVPVWGGDGLPHWASVGYIFLFPLLGHAVARQLHGVKGSRIRNWLRFSTVSYPVIVVVLATHAVTGWGAVVLPESLLDHDPTCQSISWKMVEEHLDELDVLPNVAIGTERWYEGGKAGYALGDQRRICVFGVDPRHFRYTVDPWTLVGEDVLFLGDASSRMAKLPQRLERLGQYFESFGGVHRIEIPRRFGPGISVDAIVGRKMAAPDGMGR